MLNYVRQFFKIREVFYTLYLWNKVDDPQFFCITDTSNSLSDDGKFKNDPLYWLENFSANVPNVDLSPWFSVLLSLFFSRIVTDIAVLLEVRIRPTPLPPISVYDASVTHYQMVSS